MKNTRFKRWLMAALLGVMTAAGVAVTAVPTAEAHGFYHRGPAVVLRPGYHRHVRVFGGGPRVYLAPRHYYGRREHHRYGEYHRTPYYRY